MACYNIMTILVNHRSKNTNELQKVLTKYGCMVKVRLGLHEAENVCSEEGLIILQLNGSNGEIEEFKKELNSLEGILAKSVEMCS